MKTKTFLLAITAGYLMLSTHSFAADMNMHDGMHMAMDPKPVTGLEAINTKMHSAMMVKPSGNADVDFVRGMIPHHQGAVEMAQWVLKNGKDHEVRALAQNIIKAQKGEIAWMNAWLKKNAK